MHGNVSEWCRDWYDDDYYGRSPEEDPENATPSEYRVVRGGCYFYDPASCRSANRDRHEPSQGTIGLGFRVVVTAEP
jgi:formylglycine-generating enzyme required for sulfatase activity